jgi:hypothetical protein
MSYDLAVWEGDRPPSDQAAGVAFRLLYKRYVGAGDPKEPPSSRIRAYVLALLARYPDMSEDEHSPWSTSPLLNEAVGPLAYFPMGYRQSEEVSAWAAQLAAELGLVCYDPQLGRLRP